MYYTSIINYKPFLGLINAASKINLQALEKFGLLFSPLYPGECNLYFMLLKELPYSISQL